MKKRHLQRLLAQEAHGKLIVCDSGYFSGQEPMTTMPSGPDEDGP